MAMSMKKSVMKMSMKKASMKKMGSMKKVNEYFKLMLDAKAKDLASFQYNGKTYKKSATKTGLVVYKAK